MSDNTLSRRDFLQRAVVIGVAAAGAGAFLAACDKSGGAAGGGGKAAAPGAAPQAAAGLDCTDVSALSEPQKLTRTNNAYVEKSTVAGQDCANCALYTLPKEEGGCGGCAVVAGPINPAGWCKLWVAKA